MAHTAVFFVACAQPPPVSTDCRSRPFVQRWVWDTLVIDAIPTADAPTLNPGEPFCVGGVVSGRRPVLAGPDTVGYIRDSLAHREPLPALEEVLRYAKAEIGGRVAFPSTVRFPAVEPEATHCGGGRFTVRSTLWAEDADGTEHPADWRVELRRGAYRWVVDHATVTPAGEVTDSVPTDVPCAAFSPPTP